MKRIKLKKLICDNFQCFSHKEVDFYDRTTVCGVNGVGKSTLYNAMLWCLFDKDYLGNSATSVRPHDENGVELDFVDISVSCTFDVDGREITLKKVQKQEWVKDRATQEQKFKGNKNTFFVNDIPKAQKDFNSYVNEQFCDMDTFLSCTNASAFFKLDTKKRRAKLMTLTNEISDMDVVATNDSFRSLQDELKDGTVEELTIRSKSSIKRLNETLTSIPIRIDELQKQKVDVDVAELELLKNSLNEQILAKKNEIVDTDKKIAECQKLSDGIMELKFAESDMIRKANEENAAKRRAIENKISDKKFLVKQTERTISDCEYQIEVSNRHLSVLNESLGVHEINYKQLESLVFDEKSLVCSYCGQEYPQDKKEQIRADFEIKKAEDIKKITNLANNAKDEIKDTSEKIKKAESELAEHKKSLEMLNKAISDLEKELSALPDDVDISGTDEYKAICKQIDEKSNAIFIMNDQSANKRMFERQLEDLNNELLECEKKIASYSNNLAIEERISQLQSEQRQTAQMIANEQRKLDLLESFSKAKMNMLTESVNKHFKIVKWRLFDPQINGGYSDCCKIIVNGSDYDHGLNHGHRILSELDILNTFQEMNGLRLPIFADDTESVDSWRLPALDTQTVFLRRSDNEEMVVLKGDE